MLARSRSLDRLGAQQFDLLVIGGGIVGASVALDAATRGLSVAIVQRHDFGSAYGGLGPLLLRPPNGAGGAEQRALLRNTNYLARPLLLTSPEQFGAKPVTAYLVDGARYNLMLLLTAAQQGATVLNYAAAQQLLYRNGRASGAAIRDELTETHGGQQLHEVRAKVVVNAAGSAVDAVRSMDDLDAAALLAPRGQSRVTLGKQLLPEGVGLLIPLPQHGRTLVVVPWLGRTVLLVGGVGRARDQAPDLAQLLGYLPEPVTADDVQLVWAGHALTTSRTSSYLEASRTGLLSVVGLQWHGARRLAQDAVDAAVARGRLRPARRSATVELPLLGAAAFTPGGQAALAERYGLDADVAQQLSRAYGDRAPQVAQLATAGLGARLAPGLPFIEAQVKYAAEAELAQTADDVLERRTGLAHRDRLAAEAARGHVQQLLEGTAPGAP